MSNIKRPKVVDEKEDKRVYCIECRWLEISKPKPEMSRFYKDGQDIKLYNCTHPSNLILIPCWLERRARQKNVPSKKNANNDCILFEHKDREAKESS